MASQPSLVPGYAGHGDAVARRRSDQQVRAWVGELLVDLQDRLPLDGVRERVDALLMRCEFADQHVVHAIEDDRFGQDEYAVAIEDYDRKLVAAAGVCTTVTAEELTALVDSLERAFTERAAGIEARLKG
jgi:acyl CoA:acetate/3-ketoacid CoA transferase alpha subunit